MKILNITFISESKYWNHVLDRKRAEKEQTCFVILFLNERINLYYKNRHIIMIHIIILHKKKMHFNLEKKKIWDIFDMFTYIAYIIQFSWVDHLQLWFYIKHFRLNKNLLTKIITLNWKIFKLSSDYFVHFWKCRLRRFWTFSSIFFPRQHKNFVRRFFEEIVL